MKDIKLVVFDMAGTTVDEDNVVYKTVQKAIQDFQIDVSLEEVLAFGAGKEKRQAIFDILVNCTGEKHPEEKADEIFAHFKPELVLAYQKLAVKTFPGVKECMENLRNQGVKVALNTGYDRLTAQSLLDKLDWKVARDIDALVTASDVERGRPYPDMITKAMEICGISDPQKVLKAGDSAIDIEEGKSAHCGLTVGVLSGAQTEEQMLQAQPDCILASLAELPKYLGY